MGKPTRSGEQLRAMVQVRLNALREVQRRVAADPHETPIVSLPRRQYPDRLGRNWDIDDLQHGIGLVASLREVVDALRDAYDLE